jgi:hypothetical protein
MLEEQINYYWKSKNENTIKRLAELDNNHLVNIIKKIYRGSNLKKFNTLSKSNILLGFDD